MVVVVGCGKAGRGACMHNSQGIVPPKIQEPGAGSVVETVSRALHGPPQRHGQTQHSRHETSFAGVVFCSSDVCAFFIKRRKKKKGKLMHFFPL